MTQPQARTDAQEGLAPPWRKHLLPPATDCGAGGANLSRVQKWGFGVIGFAVMALLPIYTPSSSTRLASASTA